MADELFKLENGEWSMIRAEDSPASWHVKESIIPASEGFEGFRNHPLTKIKFLRSSVYYKTDRNDDADNNKLESHVVILRSDTKQPVSVVGSEFKLVQPSQVLEFFHDLCEKNHLRMDNFGMIRNGAKFWALARTGNEFKVGNNDVVKQYVLLATAVDGSMATTAKHSSLRVVCSNTLHASLGNGESAVKVRHSREFNEVEVKMNLGLMDDEFAHFSEYAQEMAKFRLSLTDAMRWFAELISNRIDLTDEEIFDMYNKSRVYKSLWQSYTNAPGAEPTLWGAVNGVTHNVDWIKGRSMDTRFDSAQFGAGANLKQAAWEKAAAVINSARAANDAISALTA